MHRYVVHYSTFIVVWCFMIKTSGGWTLSVEDASKAPLILVKFELGDLCYRSRFDVDNKWFLDMVPSDVSMEKREELIEEINKHLQK